MSPQNYSVAIADSVGIMLDTGFTLEDLIELYPKE